MPSFTNVHVDKIQQLLVAKDWGFATCYMLPAKRVAKPEPISYNTLLRRTMANAMRQREDNHRRILGGWRSVGDGRVCVCVCVISHPWIPSIHLSFKKAKRAKMVSTCILLKFHTYKRSSMTFFYSHHGNQ
jgi:hypothetical protein